MADKKQAPAKGAAKPHESAYSIPELAANAKRLFGVSTDVATAALRKCHVRSLTISEARTIIKSFAERKVND